MKFWFALCLTTLIFCSCSDKKTSLRGSDKIEINDFIDGFKDIKLPIIVYDSNAHKLSDTTLISKEVFYQFVADSILTSDFSKEKKLQIHSIGKYEVKNNETYLLVNVESKKLLVTYLLVFTKEKIFSAGIPLYKSNFDSKYDYSASLDKRLTINFNRSIKTNTNDVLYYRTTYVHNNAGTFTIVLTETNDNKKTTNEIINPLDTFPQKNKYSGNYIRDAKNFISVRDGAKPTVYKFFIHFENKNAEQCSGELKGEFTIASLDKAIFTEKNGPCVIDFSFSGNEIKVKERGICGNYRGIKCFFNDSFIRKRIPKKNK